jgi:hypothetical protein
VRNIVGPEVQSLSTVAVSLAQSVGVRQSSSACIIWSVIEQSYE